MSTASAQKSPATTKATAPAAQKLEAPAKAPTAATAPKTGAPAAKDTKAATKAPAAAPEAAKAPAATKATVKLAPIDSTKAKTAAPEAAKAPTKAPIKLAKAPAAAKAPASGAAANPENGENGGEAKPKKARHQVTMVLGLDVSQARVTTHLKNNLGDVESETRIKELRGQLKAAKDAGDDAQAEELKGLINEEAKKLVRISSDAPIALATAADVMVKELIRHAMQQAHAADRRMVEVSHIHTGQTSELSTWPLFRNLPSFEHYSEEAEEELKRKRAAANKEAKEAREAKKGAAAANGAAVVPAKGAVKGAAKVPAAPVEEPAEEEPADLEPHTGKMTFFTYVESALKKVKDEGPNFRNMRVSNRLREYCADLITELIVRFSRLARIIVMSVMGVRTLTADHIVSIVRVLMVDEHRDEDVVEETVAHIREKLVVFHEHVEAERRNKMSLLPEEKRKELEQKRTEQENMRKRKAAETAQKRAEEAASRAAELAEKVAQLPAVEAAVSEDGDGAEEEGTQ